MKSTVAAVAFCALLCTTVVTAVDLGGPGSFDIKSFGNDNINIIVSGNFTGIASNGQHYTNEHATGVVGAINGKGGNRKLLQADCQVLTLTITSVFLDALGLNVDIPEPVVVNITAVPGASALLGNLLCLVANLLDGISGGNLGGAAGGLGALLGTLLPVVLGLLNTILSLLGSL